ncbi:MULTISPECIES: L-dopachrome tautomerase-related protein [Halomonas]|uniref:L-dopachrome tautomerase-related protein n=1 Tax=Halomonas TaxID=2745 RepID=UPI001C957945|nr:MULTISPECIES: L-dopachrome tautomerase-related protein [Halomonas]MBY6208988.1 hypothetical protein [Halomonas sp. DP3Y7-2]MBY6227458.1 hypothetical protein [Halomonas sp. DP3Y7-1]MCA0914791.1 hypothetical protein [Halomonas denitrificans]
MSTARRRAQRELPRSLLLSALMAAALPVTAVAHDPLQGHYQAAAEPLYRGEIRSVAELPLRPGNVTVTAEGRIFSTVHPMDGDHDVQLIEITGPHSYRAWPSPQVQTHGGDYTDDTIDSPLGIALDGQGGLWITDMGNHLGKTRLWGFDIASGELIDKITLPQDIAPEGSFVQDLEVDRERGVAYLADIAKPGIITLDLESGEAHRFDDHPSLQAEASATLTINGEDIQFGGEPASVGVNPITLSANGETLFYGAMNGQSWYAMPTDLLVEDAERDDLANAITRVGDKPVSDGADTVEDGRHFFTNLNENGVDILTMDGRLEPLVRDERLDWPDSVRLADDGWLYVAVNQLHKAPPFTGGDDEGKAPYAILKVWVGDAETEEADETEED